MSDLFTAPEYDQPSDSAQKLALPPRIDPAQFQRMEERILPSGRAVRMRRITTREYLDAKERAAGLVGALTATNQDPQGRRTADMEEREMMALCVVAYTDPFDWTPWMQEQLAAQQAQHEKDHPAVEGAPPPPPFLPNLDAVALLERLPEGAWRRTTPMELLTPGPHDLAHVFDEVADWTVLIATGAKLLLPSRDFSAIVGKARPVQR